MKEILVDTPIGQLQVIVEQNTLYKVQWQESSELDTAESRSEIADNIADQLVAYFSNADINWSVNYANVGTAFQRRVWQYLQTIPCGETRTYTEVADALSTSCRPVANACRANPFVIIVPCHRVVSKNGIGGYSGQLSGNKIAMKQWLLAHERR